MLYKFSNINLYAASPLFPNHKTANSTQSSSKPFRSDSTSIFAPKKVLQSKQPLTKKNLSYRIHTSFERT